MPNQSVNSISSLQALWTLRTWPESAKSLGILSAVLLLALLPHVTHLPIWIPLCVISAMLWRLWIEVHARALPNKWLRNGLALIAMLGVVSNFRSLNGLEAGTALLSTMAGIKLLESRQLRDYSILIFIALFLLFAELLYEQEIILLPYLLLCTTLSITCLLCMHDGGAGLRFRDALWRSTRMLLQALPLAALLFLLVPRLPGQFWVLPSRDAATSGLSDEMSPGDVSDLSLSSEVAFRVEFTGAPPPTSQRYWRAVVLHDFDGRTWRYRRGEALSVQQVIAKGKTYSYRMLMEPSNQRWIPVLDMPLQTNLRRSFLTSNAQLIAWQPVTQLIAVDVVAATDYQLGGSLSAAMRRIDTRLQGALNPRSRVLANEMYTASNDPASYVNAMLKLFREQAFFYTLEPPKLGTNTVDDFLFNTRRGFCEHFASAFTFMMRAAGIPARVVTGYLGGEVNTVNDYLVVRQSDAHAWSEVWLDDRGWVRVDPTAAIAPQRVERGLDSAIAQSESVPGRTLRRWAWLYQARQNWDAVNTFWKARIVNFDSEDQRNVLTQLGIKNPDWRTLGWGLLITFISFFVAMMVWLGWKYRPKRHDPIVQAYNALKRKLEKAGISTVAHEGPVDFLTRAAAAKPAAATQLAELSDLYIALRYKPDAMPQQLSRLRYLVSQLRL
ncbi:MAG: transglutaminaseTgpA domain-containing protein [Steroidobacteraceae bacterium]